MYEFIIIIIRSQFQEYTCFALNAMCMLEDDRKN